MLHHLRPQPPRDRCAQVDNLPSNSPSRAIEAAASGKVERASFHLATGERPRQDRQQQRQPGEARGVETSRHRLPEAALVYKLAACAHVLRAAMRKRIAERGDPGVVVEQERKKRCAVVRRTDDEGNSQLLCRSTLSSLLGLGQLLRRSGFRHAVEVSVDVCVCPHRPSVLTVVRPLYAVWCCR